MLSHVTDSQHWETLSLSAPGDHEGDPLLVTRLIVPPLRPGLVPRPRLLARLDAGLERRLTLVSGRAGAGKTTLLSAWALHCASPVAWLSLDENDDDLFRFWRAVVACLERVQTEFRQALSERLHALQTPFTKSVVIVLVNTLAALPCDVALVLDNYDVIEERAIHQTLGFLLEHLPPNVHVFVAGRRLPPLPLVRLRAHGHLCEVLDSDLCFTREEATSFLTVGMKVPLPERVLASFLTRAEGWITGLHLGALAWQTGRSLPGMRGPGGDEEGYLGDYFANEVWHRLPAEVQTFVQQTSLLDRFCAPLCNALTGRDDGGHTIEWLARHHLFLVPLPGQSQWFRYHSLFQDFGQRCLQHAQGGDVQRLHRQASRWYEQQRQVPDAVRHALAAEDFLKAACLMMWIGKSMIEQNQMGTLRRWLEALPEPLVRSLPQLNVIRTWLLIVDGSFEHVQNWLHYARRRIEQSPQTQAGAGATMSTIALRTYVTLYQGSASYPAEQAHQALALLPKDDLLVQALGLLNAGFTSWFEGHSMTAMRTLARVKRTGQIINNASVTLVALAGLVHMHLFQGQLHNALKTCQQALSLIAEQECRALWMAPCVAICAGYVLYEWNELEASAQQVQEGIALAEEFGHNRMMVYGFTILACVSQARGEQEQALLLLQQAGRCMPEDGSSSWIVAVARALQMRLAVVQGNREELAEWQPVPMDNAIVRAVEGLTRARILLDACQLAEAGRVLDELLGEMESRGHTGFLIEVLLLQALLSQRQRAFPRALATLLRALELAEPEGSMRLFLAEGEPLLELLTAALDACGAAGEEPALAGYIKKLLLAGGRSPQARARPLPTGKGGPFPEELSGRESEIVRLMLAGLSNQEIARQLVLAENTVKWYVKSIYSKLGVHNRVQALLRARELRL